MEDTFARLFIVSENRTFGSLTDVIIYDNFRIHNQNL